MPTTDVPKIDAVLIVLARRGRRMALQRILCVDDEPDMRTLLDIGLSTVGGFEVRLCESGQDALEVLEAFTPDLIILDVVMPLMDGQQTLHAIRGCHNANNCPVLFLTASVQPDEIRRLVELGAVTVISKPFDPMTLAEKIRDLEKNIGSIDNRTTIDAVAIWENASKKTYLEF